MKFYSSFLTALIFFIVSISGVFAQVKSLHNSIQTTDSLPGSAGANSTPDTSALTREKQERITFHFQATVVHQKHLAFKAAFNGVLGANGGSTLDNHYEQATSLTSTIYLGARLWHGASAYFNPEISGGRGFSNVTGIAGFPNGETYKVGNVSPTPFVGRLYFQQTFALSDRTEYQADDINQLAGYVPTDRILVKAGKYSLLDIFDDNAVVHDPRADFLNWALMGMGAWDYPADTRGYTLAVSGQYTGPVWGVIFAVSTMPTTGNGPRQDLKVLKAHSVTLELERKYLLAGKPGKLKLIFYDSKYNGRYYADLTRSIHQGDTLPVARGSGDRAIKWGMGLNLEQALSRDIILAARASWNDGHAVTWAFTPIDRSYSVSAKLTGKSWGRPEDIIGLSGLLNGIAPVHRAYLAAGGLDYLIGDGKLPHYSMEKIIEAYYTVRFKKVLYFTPDYQYVDSPAYNPLRGPVHIFALRLHIEY